MKFYGKLGVFRDAIESLQHEYARDKSNNIVLFGAHQFPYVDFAKYKTQYDKVIVFNMEQLPTKMKRWIDCNYYSWIKSADEVWDYDEANIAILKHIRPDVKLHVLQPYKDWSAYENTTKTIDILFYGAINEHRKLVLDYLKTRYNVCILKTWDPHILDTYISKSSILLNLHYFHDCNLQEQARMVRWINSPCRIISETSVKNYLNVPEMSYESLLHFNEHIGY